MNYKKLQSLTSEEITICLGEMIKGMTVKKIEKTLDNPLQVYIECVDKESNLGMSYCLNQDLLDKLGRVYDELCKKNKVHFLRMFQKKRL